MKISVLVVLLFLSLHGQSIVQVSFEADDLIRVELSESTSESAGVEKLFRISSERALGRWPQAQIYYLASSLASEQSDQSLLVNVRIPRGWHLIYGGQVWRDSLASREFPNYSTAREFPLILVRPGQYYEEIIGFNAVDRLTVVYVGLDGEELRTVQAATAAAAANIGDLAPTYWHKNIQHYGGVPYLLTLMAAEEPTTIQEHFNAPYVVAAVSAFNEPVVYEALVRSLISQATRPLETDGGRQADESFIYSEGLPVFLSLRYMKDGFKEALSDIFSRAEEDPAAKAYLFWLMLQEQGLNVDLFVRWLFSIRLINEPFPYETSWGDVLRWIISLSRSLEYQRVIPEYEGKYYEKVSKVLGEDLESNSQSSLWQKINFYLQ